jgi:tellurite resistance protein TerC
MELPLVAAGAAAVLVGLAVEQRFFARGRAARRGEALAWSVGWFVLALLIAGGIAIAGGPAGAWTTVYLIERLLSLDNVFLFSLLLVYFAVPPELRGRVIAIGIVGALALRGLAIVGGLALVEAAEAVVFVFGGLLLYVAYRALRGQTEAADPSANPVLRLVRRLIPTTDEFRGKRLFVREGERLSGTPLLLVVISIVLADIAFAIDSVPAALAVTRDAGVIWTANAFALLGLGAFLALVDILVRRFRYLDETIALILGFVGLKILIADLVPIGDLASLAVIALLLAGGVSGSLLADRLDPPAPTELASRKPPRCPPELATMQLSRNVALEERDGDMPTCTHLDRIAVTELPASIAGCEECLKIGSPWLHLRMCMSCGKIGCCDSSPNKHASRHAREDDHPIARSAEPGEDWSWCFVDELAFVVASPVKGGS